jgi:dienelactone hydrolase
LLKNWNPVRVRVVLANNSGQSLHGRLAAQVVGHLDTVYPLAAHDIELAAMEKRAVTIAWNPPGPIVYEGMPMGPARVAGATWGQELHVAWLGTGGEVQARGRTVFVVDREGTCDRLAEQLARATTLTPHQAFALRYSGYLTNAAFSRIEAPCNPSLQLSAGKAVQWRKGDAPTGYPTYLVNLAASEKPAEATLLVRAAPARLRQAWLLDAERSRAWRLRHRADQRRFEFTIPPTSPSAVLVLEMDRSHHVPAVPLAELVARGERQFGKFRDLLADPDGKPIRTPAAWEQHRATLRAAIRASLGSPLKAERAPADAKLISSEVVPGGFHVNGLHGGYVRQRLSLRTRDGERMNVWLLIPHGIGPFPAVVACHQTVAEGKDEPAGLGGVHSQVNFGPFLAGRGFVVLAADSPTAGERYDPDKDAPWDTRRYEKDPDWCLLGQRLWDHQRCIDYLESLPFVDRRRIGAIGHSLGGESVLVLTAMDDRIAAAAASCWGPLLRTLDNAGQVYASKGHVILSPRYRKLLDVPVRDRRLPFDFDDCMALCAPRPVFFHEVTDELPHWTNHAQTALALDMLGHVYEFHGARDHLHVHYSRQAHCFPQWVQQDAFDWLDYWLAGRP